MSPLPADLRSKDYYRLLGVERGATDTEVAKAYKSLAFKHHPDKNPENREAAEATFKKVTEAYEVLRDPEKRKRHDALGPHGPEAAVSGGRGGTSRSHADDMFDALFFDVGAGMGAPGRCGRQAKDASPAHVKPRGASVVVRGLTRAAEHNGKSAEVCGWDEARGRYEVRLEEGEVLSLRPSNVVQLCTVEVAALRGRPELNGLVGRILGFDEARGRYRVLLDGLVMVVALQPSNCVLLDEGVQVLLQGLSTSPELNGQMAQVKGVERASSRYTVCTQGGRYVRVKYDNVMC
mmetsp:Transcript_71233/g.202058  ORF Transcript_71233/g.202058 Transcript_71233/m.202058 type:complete len:292 (-) Transcript_71233:141-1016(-)